MVTDITIRTDSTCAMHAVRSCSKPKANARLIHTIRAMKTLPSPLKATILWTKGHSTEKTEEAHWNNRVDRLAAPPPSLQPVDPEVRLCLTALIDVLAPVQPVLAPKPSFVPARRYEYDPRSEEELVLRLAAEDAERLASPSLLRPTSVPDAPFAEADFVHLLRPSAFADDVDWLTTTPLFSANPTVLTCSSTIKTGLSKPTRCKNSARKTASCRRPMGSCGLPCCQSLQTVHLPRSNRFYRLRPSHILLPKLLPWLRYSYYSNPSRV